MGKVAAAPNTRLWVNQYDISGFANSAGFTVTQETMDARAFSTTGPSLVVGNHDNSHEATVLWDGDASQSDAIIASLLGDTEHYFTECWGANVEGSVAYDSIVKLSRQPIQAANSQLIMINLGLGGAGHIARGLVLCNATVTGTGNRTGRNQGATTAGTTYAAIVRVLSGTFASITIRIQESQNDGGADPYADIAGMTTTMTGPGVARLTTTAATEAWKRATIQAFTGTNAVVVVTGGRVAGT